MHIGRCGLDPDEDVVGKRFDLAYVQAAGFVVDVEPADGVPGFFGPRNIDAGARTRMWRSPRS